MRKIVLIAVAAVFALFASPPAAASAQTGGSIAGTVTDADSGLPIVGAQVSVPTLGIGILTRDGGQFVLAGVPAGTHELLVERIGHLAETRSVTVPEGESVFLEIEMVATVLAIEGVVVTGTAFSESPVELPYAVSVSGRRTLAEQGSPQGFDFFRNVTASQGILGNRQGWYNTRPPGVVSETVASVNLRGIGASRTLVLLNGRRQVYLPIRLAGGRFVDVNAFPSVALDRVEVVKEGASAIYGSDAVAGVVNFLTRSDFEGLEISGAHEYFAHSGETSGGLIWGSRLGESAHAVLSAELFATQELTPEEAGWALSEFTPGGGGWSYTGNPGAFLFPRLTGSETKDQFVTALTDAHYGGWGGVFVDPNCREFGGFLEEAETCRFRYDPYDNLLGATRQVRTFGELNGALGDRGSYHLEALWALAETPEWVTTPSYPPISPYNGTHLIAPSHPGRQAFCSRHGAGAGFASTESCLENDWYFFGRMVGNAGPARTLRRESNTMRLAGSLERPFEGFGGREMAFELAAGFSRSTGNSNLPGEYLYRKFLAFRGFGGPNCGVEVVADPSSPSGMALGPTGGKVPGQGDCLYYNPFSNAHQFATQPGAPFRDRANPDFAPGLENRAELLDWMNDEANLDNRANLLVVDAILKNAPEEEEALGYAAGYQFRRLSVGATPNAAGDLTATPCPVPGDHSCAEPFGPFHFTTGFFQYEDAQIVHRFFAESQLALGSRIRGQVAANYEFHGSVRSFDPKVALRFDLPGPLALRTSVQTTFRTPSVDDLNEDLNTGLEYVSAAGIYKAVDTYGNHDLVPERAFTYNVGASLELRRMRASLDYWSYDFDDVIDILPYEGIASLYAAGGSQREAVREYVTCPDGRGTGSCDVQSVERIEARFVNWPGISMSGLDLHAAARIPAGQGVVSFGLDATWIRKFFVRALDLNDAEVFPEHDAAGKLNWGNPIAPPLPQWKTNLSAGFHQGDYSAVSYLNTISGYTNEAFAGTRFEEIDRFATVDLSLLRRASDQLDIGLSVLNLLDRDPPLVRWEQSYDGFTHSPKGMRIKLQATWRPQS